MILLEIITIGHDLSWNEIQLINHFDGTWTHTGTEKTVTDEYVKQYFRSSLFRVIDNAAVR
jgi:hypothetical protein